MSAAQYEPDVIKAFLELFYGDAQLNVVPYAYTAQFTGLAPGTTQAQIVTIAANADFLYLATHYHASIAAAAQNVGNKTVAMCRLLITDTGSSESFTATAADLENYAQNAPVANSLPYPRLIGGLTSLNVQLTNFSTTETYVIDLFFEGMRIRKL